MKKYLLISIIVFVSHFGFAQTEQAPPKSKYQMGMSIYGGYNWLDISELNSQMTANGYLNFKTRPFGFGMDVSLGNVESAYTTLDIYSYNSVTTSSMYKEATLTGFSTSVGLNYMAYKTGKLYFVPNCGLGMSALTVSLSDQSGSAQSFGSAVAELKNERTLYTEPALLFRAGAAINYKLIQREKAIWLGIRTGYQWQLTAETRWGAGGYELSGGPNINLGKWYFALAISFF